MQLTNSMPCGKGVSSQSFCGNLWIIFPRPAPDPSNKIKVNYYRILKNRNTHYSNTYF